MKFSSSINLPKGHVRSHTNFGPDRFSRFDVYWPDIRKQTNTQTDTQTSKETTYIDFLDFPVYKNVFEKEIVFFIQIWCVTKSQISPYVTQTVWIMNKFLTFSNISFYHSEPQAIYWDNKLEIFPEFSFFQFYSAIIIYIYLFLHLIIYIYQKIKCRKKELWH